MNLFQEKKYFYCNINQLVPLIQTQFFLPTIVLYIVSLTQRIQILHIYKRIRLLQQQNVRARIHAPSQLSCQVTVSDPDPFLFESGSEI